MRRIAIIGASSGQLPLCIKAKKMGLETFCYAWSKGAICKDYVDHFIPISVFETDKIVESCKKNNIEGIVSNASEMLTPIVSYIAEKLNLICTPFHVIKNIQDKEYVRQITNNIKGIGVVSYKSGKLYDIINKMQVPFVLKPCKGAAKKGVNFIQDKNDKIQIPEDIENNLFLAEQYIDGREYSVESLSYKGIHKIIQITEKISSGAPHFVELEHHQPANLSKNLMSKINILIPEILSSLNFTNGASHIEIKITDNGEIYLIEVNPRGGGDFISNSLIGLSTDCDYLKQIILISLGEFRFQEVHKVSCSGVYFLCEQSKRLLPYFESICNHNNANNNIIDKSWIVEISKDEGNLTNSTSNHDRNGYLIYNNNTKIIL